MTGSSGGDVVFGVFMPQGWKMELSGIDGAAAKWSKAVDVALRAEELGYDSIWLYDHFHNVPRPAHEAVFECWTTIAAISQLTSRIRLGQMVGCNSYRNPALLAKITSTVDVISGGRLDWGIGAGWYENEYRSYGYEFPKPKDRIGMLRECVEIVRSMWTEPETTYKGKYYEVARAHCDPKPIQSPHPPIWVGGGGEQLTLRVVARHADCSNFGGKPDQWAHKRDVLREHCASVGRDPDAIRMTWSPEMFIRRTQAELDAAGSKSLWGEERSSWVEGNLVGTPEQVADKIQTYVDLGCRGFVPWCADYPDTESLELLATEVVPNFRRTGGR
jgi:F420-dependent oxidoreductase-like protein